MNGGCLPYSGCRCFREANVTDHAFPDKVGKRAYRVFDRDIGIYPGWCVEIDVICFKALKAVKDSVANVVRMSIYRAGSHRSVRTGSKELTGFNGDKSFVALAFNGPGNQLFVVAHTVVIGRV